MWHGFPPEVNTGRLIAGAGAQPYLQAEVGWQTLAADFTAATTALQTQIAVVSGAWQGMASTQAQAAFQPYLAWMATVIAMAQQRAAAAAAQASAYSMAVATTPSLGEIAENHITHAVLQATNFLGVNTVPIAVNEFQYFVEMWNRAAGVMESYASATGVNTTFPPFPPAPPIMAAPGAPEAGLAAVLSQTAAALPASMARNAVLASLGASSLGENVKGRAQAVGQLSGIAGNAAASAGQQGAQRSAEAAAAAPMESSQMATQMSQMAMQAPQMAAQLPQQAGQLLGQGPQQFMQMASQPLQQLTQLFGQGAGSDLASQGISNDALMSHFGSVDQMGMYGTSPVGSAGGAYGGAGLLGSGSSGATLRSPAGWTPPIAAAPQSELAASRATVAGSGTGAVGSGTGMMGPMAGAMRGAEGAMVAVDEPEVDERHVVASLGFDTIDSGDDVRAW
ncbi:PPE family protein [Mycobacterium sp. NPDC003323]